MSDRSASSATAAQDVRSSVYTTTTAELQPWIRAEVDFPGELGRGSRGAGVRRAQEWLTLHGHALVVDGVLGPASRRAVADFQYEWGLDPSGLVDEETWQALVSPLTDVLRQRLTSCAPLGDAVVEYANAHLAVHPREVGGHNRGPWVRLYMRGWDGPGALWCAAFARFVLVQAVESVGAELPVAGSSSCDQLAAQGQDAGLFLAEDDVTPDHLSPGTLFLVRRAPGDWNHAGIVEEAYADSFSTIEGNTNDEGDREGYEVCARTRDYRNKDFVLI